MTFDEVAGQSVLIGGSASVYLNDIWHYAAATDTWTAIEPASVCAEINDHVPPTGRDEMAIEYDPVNRLYWMFGGSGYGCKGSARTAQAGTTSTSIVDATLASETVDFYKDWTVEVNGTKAYVSGYDPGSRTLGLATPIAAATAGSSYLLYPQRGGGTWYYSPVTGAWARLDGPHWGYTGPSPSSRLSPAFAYSSGDRALVMFGGAANSSARNDTWALDAETRSWLQLIPHGDAGSPPPLSQLTNSMRSPRPHAGSGPSSMIRSTPSPCSTEAPTRRAPGRMCGRSGSSDPG